MKCPYCGLANPASARTCKRCGTPLASAARTGSGKLPVYRPVRAELGGVNPVNVHDAARAKPGEGIPQTHSTRLNPVHLHHGTQPKKHRWYSRTFMIALAAILIVSMGAGSWAFVAHSRAMAEQEAAYKTAHQLHTVDVALDVPDYVQGSSSAIPIRISGTDIDEEQVEQLELMTANKHRVDLLQGSYTFTPAGSPATRGGTIYLVPAPQAVSIEADGALIDGNHVVGPAFSYIPIPSDQVTDAQVIAVRAWMADDAAMNDATVQSFINAITSARAEAQDKVSASESEIETSSFSFTIPSYWQGKVDTKVAANDYGLSAATMYLRGTNYKLAWVETVPANVQRAAENGSDHLIVSIEGPGYRVEAWSTNWAREAAIDKTANVSSYDTSLLYQLVRLSTGNTMTYSQAIARGADDVGTPDAEFLAEELVPSLAAI